MKNSKALFFSLFLLSSCANTINAPSEITDYLSACSLKQALSSVKTISATWTNSIIGTKDEKVYGTYLTTINVDRNDMGDYYNYTEMKMTGDLITQDANSHLYVTKATAYTVYSKADLAFSYELYQEGYENADKKGDIKTYSSRVLYTKDQIIEESKKVFYTTVTENLYTGGLYYADFFKSKIKYYDYMKVEDDVFVYTLDNFGFKSDDEEGYVDEVAYMNNIGMVTKVDETSNNVTSKKKSVAEINVIYNEKITRK